MSMKKPPQAHPKVDKDKEIEHLKQVNASLVGQVRKLTPPPSNPNQIVPMHKEMLVAFNDGSYKKITHVSWRQTQWIHFMRADLKEVHVNRHNVLYLEEK